jgi:hypothetical protein
LGGGRLGQLSEARSDIGFDQRELNEFELDAVSGGNHRAEVTVPGLKLDTGFSDHQ